MDSSLSSFRARVRRRLPDSDRVRQRLQGLVPRVRDRARALRRRLRGTAEGTLTERLADLDDDYVRRKAKDLTETDLDTIVERADAIEKRFRSEGPLRRLLEDGRLLLGLVRDARRGTYRAVPVWTLSAVGVALLYVLNPLDVIPDALPLLGLIDDAAVVSACLSLVEQDLRDYKHWRQSHAEDGADLEGGSEELISCLVD